MKLAREKPAEGLKTAQAWEKNGGGAPSRHCLAVATDSLGDGFGFGELCHR